MLIVFSGVGITVLEHIIKDFFLGNSSSVIKFFCVSHPAYSVLQHAILWHVSAFSTTYSSLSNLAFLSSGRIMSALFRSFFFTALYSVSSSGWSFSHSVIIFLSTTLE